MTVIQERCSFYIAELKEKFPNLTSTLTVEQKTTLVEAFLFNYPLPQVILIETDYEKYEFLKGEQVVGALLDFYNGKFKLTTVESDKTTPINKLENTLQQGRQWNHFIKKRIPAIVLLTENENLEQITNIRDKLKELHE